MDRGEAWWSLGHICRTMHTLVLWVIFKRFGMLKLLHCACVIPALRLQFLSLLMIRSLPPNLEHGDELYTCPSADEGV